MGNVVPKQNIEASTLSRIDTSLDDLVYDEHDTQIDASAIIKPDPEGLYPVCAERPYPSMTQGPWVEATAKDLERDELGFTNPYLHRRLDPKLPDDETEVVPRSYTASIMSVHSYRTTYIYDHVDYQFLSDYEGSQYYSEILHRSELDDAREIP